MSALSATLITTSPAAAPAAAPTPPAATPAIPVATSPAAAAGRLGQYSHNRPPVATSPAADARNYAADSQTPSLTMIDAAILLAAAAGDIERRDALMALRADSALAEILGTFPGMLPGAGTDSGGPATRDDNA